MDEIDGRPIWYGLDHKPIDTDAAEALIPDIEARRVAFDVIGTPDGTVTVSTIFTVIDYATIFGMPGDPVLYETMILDGGPHRGWQSRTRTREEALAAHAEALAMTA